jgi:hypothetical protein
MAFRKNITVEGKLLIQFAHGIVNKGNESFSSSAYIKVTSVMASKSNGTAIVNFENDLNAFTKSFDFPISVSEGAPNFIKQAYEHLKTLPEFAGAIDC